MKGAHLLAFSLAMGARERQIDCLALEVGLPRWSPDGKRIAFMGTSQAISRPT